MLWHFDYKIVKKIIARIKKEECIKNDYYLLFVRLRRKKNKHEETSSDPHKALSTPLKFYIDTKMYLAFLCTEIHILFWTWNLVLNIWWDSLFKNSLNIIIQNLLDKLINQMILNLLQSCTDWFFQSHSFFTHYEIKSRNGL